MEEIINEHSKTLEEIEEEVNVEFLRPNVASPFDYLRYFSIYFFNEILCLSLTVLRKTYCLTNNTDPP